MCDLKYWPIAVQVPQHLIDRLLKHDSDDLEGVKFPKWKVGAFAAGWQQSSSVLVIRLY